MHVISRKTLIEFWAREPKAKLLLQAWWAEACKAHWKSPKDVKARFASADIVGNDRIVFDIGGNKYRLIARINFRSETVFIRFVGTHSEYDRIKDVGKI